MIIGMIGVPSWWYAFRVHRHDESAMRGAFNFAKVLHLPDWVATVAHRIFAPMAIVSAAWFSPLAVMSVLVGVGVVPAEAIRPFYGIFIAYWPVSVLAIPILLVTILMFGRQEIPNPKI
ncbi:hypothetical protein GCM10028833_39800 [Glycomyces tarimensis]